MIETIEQALAKKGARVICVNQQKGGVGKTTLAKILGEYFSFVRKLRVLMIDLDPQCNLSKMSLPMEATEFGARPPESPYHDASDPDWQIEGQEGRSGSYAIYFDLSVYPYPIAWPEHGDDITYDILPGDRMRLEAAAAQDLEPDQRARVKTAVRDFLLQANIADSYDIVIIDTPPSASRLALSAIKAATDLIVPVIPQQQCIDGLGEMTSIHAKEEVERPPEFPLSLLLQWNLVHGNRQTDQGMIELAEGQLAFRGLFSPVILYDRAQFADRDVHGLDPRSIFNLRPSDPARKMAAAFAEYVEQHLIQTCKDREPMYPRSELKG